MAIGAWSAPLLRGTGWEPRRVVHGNCLSRVAQRPVCRSDGCARRQGADGTLNRDAGGRPPLQTHALPTLRGLRAPFSRCDRVFGARTECVGTLLLSLWCAAAEERQFLKPGQTLGCSGGGRSTATASWKHHYCVRSLARMGTPHERMFLLHRASGVGAGMRALAGL